MTVGHEDYIYCSPFLNVVSLDGLLDRAGEEGQPFDIPDPQPEKEEEIDARRGRRTINLAVGDLPPRQRSVIREIYFHDRTVTQTAKQLKISAAAVSRLHARACKRLFGALSPHRQALCA